MSTTIELTANSQASLANAITAADVQATPIGTTFVIDIAPSATINLTSELPAIDLAPGNALVINGAGSKLQGDGNERGFLVYAGSVAIANLTITNTVAVGGNGGNGWEGGGGGAGLGGGLFVAANASVSTTNVNFVANAAVGGDGGRGNYDGYYGLGGGGGMGGSGGTSGRFGLSGSFYGNRSAPGGGGGGVGRGAGGYNLGAPAGAGIVPGIPGASSGYFYSAASGGGGGRSSGGGIGPSGRSGGFGGGGGAYGSGGFGGGAGAFGKSGGFGGGGSGGADIGPPGFGGGVGQAGGYQSSPVGYGYYGAYYARVPGRGPGGGGLGAGGNVFVQQGGTLSLGSGVLLAGSVKGGLPGGGSAQPGLGLGSAVFLQGNELLVLAPPAGEALTIDAGIADQAGSVAQATESGTIAVAGAGTVVLTAASTFTGGTAINLGTLQLDNPQAVGSGVIFLNPAGGATLAIDGAPPSNLIYGFAFGDAIQLSPVPLSVTYDAAQHVLLYDGGTLHFDPSSAPAAIDYNPRNGLLTVPCFAAGTRIATPRGVVAVEHLRVGDRVMLAEGGSAAIVWLGRRRIDVARHPRPADVRPVRIAADAFGLGRPHRTLRLSPDHAVFVDGVLIPVRYLLNDATVAQEPAAAITYWHVELERHGVLLAEGLPAESYLDSGNRAAFVNGGTVVMASADFARRTWADQGCAPLVTEGAVRDRVYARLIAQALALGWRTQDAGAGQVRWCAPAPARPIRRRRARG